MRFIFKGKSASNVRHDRGLTLLEVLIAVIVLSIAASILVVNSKTAVTGQLRSKTWGDAAIATREALESIEQMDFDSAAKLSSTPIAHSQDTSIKVLATTRHLAASDVADITVLDTVTLLPLSLVTKFKNKAGVTISKNFTTILYKP